MARLRGLLWVLVVLGAGLLCVAWVDLLVALGPLLRVMGVAGAAALGVAFAVRGSILTRRRAQPMAVARDVDCLSASGGQVTVGLDLTSLGAETAPMTLALSRMAVRRALEIASGVPEERVEPLTGVGTAFKGVLALAVVTVTVGLLWPRAFGTELVRLADPWGDHPPYSPHIFQVEPGDARVAYGDSVAVTVKVGGAPADQMDLVVQQQDAGREAVPMFEEHNGSWRAQLAHVTAPLVYWAQAPMGRSRRYSVSVIYTPRIDKLAVRITPPAYTNRAATEGPMPQGGISGLPGTEVQITAESNRPLSQGELCITPREGSAETLLARPGPDSPKAVTWSFAIQKPGSLSLAVVDEAGERSAASVTAPIFLLRDERPFVRIVSPMAESFATADIVLPVELEAEDDYGVSYLSVYKSLNSSRPLPEELMVPVPAQPQLRGTSVLPLNLYGLSPGDVISLFGRVQDTDPSNPKGSESGVVHVTIISREEYEKLMRAQQQAADFEARYEAAARHLERLSAAGEKLQQDAAAEQGPDVGRNVQDELRSWAQDLEQSAQAIAALAAQPSLYELDHELAPELQKLAQDLSQIAQHAREAAEAATLPELRQALQQLAGSLRASQGAYGQSVMQPLTQFMQAYALLELQERFVELAARQRALAQRMADLKGRDDERDPALRVRMADLQGEQEGLREELRAILDDIRARAGELPEEAELNKLRTSALEFADAVESSRALPAMDEAGQGLQALSGSQALRGASEAADVLDSFITRCRGAAQMAGRACELAFVPSLQECASTTVAQLLGRMGGGMGLGIGAGAGGYSTRSNTPARVGLYGPAMASLQVSGMGRDSHAPAFPYEATGGVAAGGIEGPGREDAAYGGAAVQAIPARYREHVRRYFQRVAQETSMGTRLDDTGEGGER